MSQKSQEFSLSDLCWEDLIPTHNELRSPSSVAYFYSYFKDNVVPPRDKPALLIQTEDNSIYIHDGHHYLYAAMKNGCSIDKLNIATKKYSYLELNDINFECGYVTPYNPQISVRRHILPEFKNYIMKLRTISESDAISAIVHNLNYYTEPRKVKKLYELQ